jgi:chromosomal replication initiation ATPase DnaA
MNTAIAERRCTICRDVLSASNTTDRCRRHNVEQGKRPLFRVVTKSDGIAKGSTGVKQTVIREVDTSVLETVSPIATPEEVLEIVIKVYEVSREGILGSRRKQWLVRSRQVVMYLLRTGLGMSFPKIANFLNRDHSTIIHGCEQIAQKIKTDPVLAKEVEAIRNRLSS